MSPVEPHAREASQKLFETTNMLRPSQLVLLLALLFCTAMSHAAGLAGRDVHAVLVAKDGTIYAGYDHGLLVSADQGASWNRVSRGLPVYEDGARTLSIHSLLEGPDGTVYAGTNGIYETKDKGLSWRPTGRRNTKSDSLVDFIGSMVMVGNDFYYGDGNGVFGSTDKGASWVRKLDWQEGAVALAVGGGGMLFAGTFRGVFKSADKGARWTRAGDAFNEFATRLVVLEGTIFAVTSAGRTGIFKSTDNGSNWIATTRGLPAAKLRDTNIGFLHAARDGTLYTDVGVAVYKSDDKGASWKSTGSGLKAASDWAPGTVYVHSFAEAADGTIFIGCMDGIYKSTDKGAKWTRVLLLEKPH